MCELWRSGIGLAFSGRRKRGGVTQFLNNAGRLPVELSLLLL